MKVKIYLAGGLGNNLFQLSLGYYLEQQGKRVVYNTALLSENRLTRLLGWSIHSRVISNEILKNRHVETKFSFIDVVFLFKEFVLSKLFGKTNYVYVDECVKNQLWGYYPIGNHMLKENILKFKRHVFEQCSNLVVPESMNEYSVVHVRRGDFSSDSILTFEYYKDALAKISDENPIFYISDDESIIHELESVTGKSLLRNSDNSMVGDFFMMLNAEKIISSNSTFCYWAGILGDASLIIHPDRISMAKSWFLPFDKRNSISLSSHFQSEKAQ